MSAPEIDFHMFADKRWATFSMLPLRADLLQLALAQDYHAAGVGRSAQRQKNTEVRSDSTAWLEFDSGSDIVSDFFTQLMSTLNRETYFGLTNFEAHFSCYQPGQFYDWHRDVLGGPTYNPRRISFVGYLHEEWRPEYGGELEFEDGTLIEPKPGVAVVFDSEKILHRVRECHFTRRSLTAWFRTGARA